MDRQSLDLTKHPLGNARDVPFCTPADTPGKVESGR
jgi:hypothetical protein